jgi:hypothetical protein
MQTTSRFDHVHKILPEPLRSSLLKDTAYELTSAWKFFARMEPGSSALVYAPGYSALPAGLARHCAHVDVIGPLAEEQALLAEVAAAKALSNLAFLRSPEEILAPYGLIVLLPHHQALHDALLYTLLLKLLAVQDGQEEWWVAVREVPALKIARRGKNFWARWRTRAALRDWSGNLRLLCAPSMLLRSAQLPQIIHGRLPRLQQQLQLAPNLAAPKQIAPAQALRERQRAFAQLRTSSRAPAEHSMLCFSASTAPVFLERLLAHLNRNQACPWRVGRQYRVLPGGKVQIELVRDQTAPASAALLKLPLIATAAARMRENANHLVRLAQAGGLLPEQRGRFPRSLAEGNFEAQPYYLESFLSGRAIEQLPAEQAGAAVIENVFAFWFAVQKRMARTVKVTAPVFHSVFGELLARVQTWLKLEAPERDRLQRVYGYWHRTFAGRELSLGIVHGDFSIKNILVDPATQQVSGVIDWDLADFFAPPLLDVLHFFVRTDARSFQEAPPAIALRLIQNQEGLHHNLFRQAETQHGYQAQDWPAIVLLYWLFRMRGYLGSSKNADAKFLRRQVFDVLALFEREVLSPRAGVVV